MIIYWLIFLLLCFSFYSFETHNVDPRKKRQILSGFYIFFFLLYSLRSYTVGTDTIGYIFNVFPQIKNLSYKEIFQNERDPFFYIVVKFVQENISDLNIVWFTFIALIFWIPVIHILKKYSYNIFMSLIILMIFRYTDFPLNAMRNGIAVGITFFSTQYLIEKKIFKFILCIIIATLFHKTALIYLLLMPFMFINLLEKKIFIYSSILFVFMFKNILYQYIFKYLFSVDPSYQMYLNIDPGKILTFLIVSFFFLLTTYFLQPSKGNYFMKIFYSSTFLSTIFGIFSLENPAFYRSSLYFGFSFAITVPYALKFIYKKYSKKFSISIILSCLLLIYILGGPAPGVVPYSFFWNPQKNSTHLMKDARSQYDPTTIYLYSSDKLPVIP